MKVSYEDLVTPLAIPPLSSDLLSHLPPRYSPLNKTGTGAQGYLFPLADEAGALLLRAMGRSEDVSGMDVGVRAAVAAIEHSALSSTEKQALIKSRIGQGRFRADLIRIWGERCAVTGLGLAPLLRASHIKPWSSSDNRERLDPSNGLLLAPQYDAAFDAGLISFSNSGELLVSGHVDPAEFDRAGILKTGRLRNVQPTHLVYLDFHRKHIAHVTSLSLARE